MHGTVLFIKEKINQIFKNTHALSLQAVSHGHPDSRVKPNLQSMTNYYAKTRVH